MIVTVTYAFVAVSIVLVLLGGYVMRPWPFRCASACAVVMALIDTWEGWLFVALLYGGVAGFCWWIADRLADYREMRDHYETLKRERESG